MQMHKAFVVLTQNFIFSYKLTN